ncbi:methyltransferase, FxLD system [Nocardiopsis sp. CNR-923]|uniref:methyltransferase, FxLD system n=1 Tax=Nocardiopsis sp. CNR-923 TaxID=1904965 RepID=UPI0009616F37|nr:methyltransferase, FxLD system [Nocardiopsis sp. CNR-923]OLT26886.1 methyltransferase, FxLD system [Nocardiopsis sp. CNR-923]
MRDEHPQILIEWPDWASAEHTATHHLAPVLEDGQRQDLLTGWWFVRKKPHWRLRYTGGLPARRFLDEHLERLHRAEAVSAWAHGIYEPETGTFGGQAGMRLAHTLFHADSRHLLTYLARNHTTQGGGLGRRELALLMGSVFLRGARLDTFEQADVWNKVTALRRLPEPFTNDEHLLAPARTLMTLNPQAMADTSPHTTTWAEEFTAAGAALADLATEGRLTRGLRAVCAHHLIFTFNRWGIAYRDQHVLSNLGKAVMTDTTNSAPSSPEDAETLREDLIQQLRKNGAITTPAVEDAFRCVPRHTFVPHATLEEAYTNAPVHIKHDDNGASISCASQPSVVALMLEQAALAFGMRVLELGAGTGYNASLLGHLVGGTGSVTTIDVDQDLVDGARTRLKDSQATNVVVHLGDGALGHPDGAPYDRIIATVGSHDVPRAWVDQLAPDGRLIAPVRIAGDVNRSIVFERDGDRWRSVDSQLCTFMPLRGGGIGDDPRRILALDPDGTVLLQANQDQTITDAQVHDILTELATTTWTGVTFGKGQPLDTMWLWLATHLDNRLSRMPLRQHAVTNGLVTPGLPWGDMAGVPATERGLAYLTLRPVEGQQGRHELGVIGHAPAGQKLAEQMADQVVAWEPHRDDDISFSLHFAPVIASSSDTRRVLEREHSTLVVAWGEPA